MLAGKPLPTNDREGGEALELAARKANVGLHTLRKANYIQKNASPKYLSLLEEGKKKVNAIYKNLKRKEKIEELRKKIPNLLLPEGKFEIVVIDPPWPYNEKNFNPETKRGTLVQNCTKGKAVEKVAKTDRCIKFARKYPTPQDAINELRPIGRSLTWYNIHTLLLPEKKEENSFEALPEGVADWSTTLNLLTRPHVSEGFTPTLFA